MKFTFNHDDYKSPIVQHSSEEYECEIGEDWALVTWSDENCHAYTGTLDEVIKESEEMFKEWEEAEDEDDEDRFIAPHDKDSLIAYCNTTELDCDSSYGFALINLHTKTVLGEPCNGKVYFH